VGITARTAVTNDINHYEATIRCSEQLQRENHRLQLLLNLTTNIASSLDLREVLRASAANIREVIPADAVVIWLSDPASGKFKVFALDFPQGKGVIKEELLVTPSAAAKKAMDTLKPVVVDTRQRHEFVSVTNELATAEDMKALCGIPLVNRGRVVGILSTGRTTETPFMPEEVDFLSRASGQIAIAIENALAFQEVSSLAARLQLLLNVTSRITSNLELRELLRAISTNIRGVMRCDMVAITLPDGPSEGQRLLALDFPNGKGLIREGLLLTPVGPGRRALESLKPTRVNALDPDAFAPEVRELAIAEGLQRYCLIPLANRGRALGALVIGQTGDASTSPEDLGFLAQVSGQITIAVENALAYREISELKDKLAQEKLYLEEEIRSEMSFENIVGNSPALKHVLELVETVAPNDSTVLLLGETGTGKELIARAIHDRSRRTERTFVKLNCAAIPTGLLESELFGHEKGAFTGAITQKIGRLELADQGTLFLDEVGDIPTEIQPKLLRALQEREFERLGSTHTRKVNVRLIAATNRNLVKMVAEREFRSDLFYRLNVFPIRIPPLRERKEDIPLLVSFFVQKFAKQMQKQIESVPSAVMKGLTGWEWPGNIRELENFIERAVILTRGKALEVPLAELRKTNTDSTTDAVVAGKTRKIRDARSSRRDVNAGAAEYERKQREEIIQALTACKGRIGGYDGAAIRLGINRTTLMYRMRKLGIYAKLYS
jgi:formate hydrogenlyase transcriptional activator